MKWGQGPFSKNFFFTGMYFNFCLHENQNWPKLHGRLSYLSLLLIFGQIDDSRFRVVIGELVKITKDIHGLLHANVEHFIHH